MSVDVVTDIEYTRQLNSQLAWGKWNDTVYTTEPHKDVEIGSTGCFFKWAKGQRENRRILWKIVEEAARSSLMSPLQVCECCTVEQMPGPDTPLVNDLCLCCCECCFRQAGVRDFLSLQKAILFKASFLFWVAHSHG